MKKANKLKTTSLILISSSLATFIVISTNYYFSASYGSVTAKYITLGNRRISILKSGSGRVYKMEEPVDNAPCLLPGCAGQRDDDTSTEKLRNELASQNSTRHSLKPIEMLAETNPPPCTGMGQDCSSIHLESLNAPKSIDSLSGHIPHRPTASETNTSFSDGSSSTAGEICYHYTEAGRCALAPCPGQQVAHTHYRGRVREVQYPGPAHPNRTYGACFMCSIYSRQCMVSVAHRFIYIHVMKTGGNTFQSFLQGALCGDPATNRKHACPWAMRDRLQFMPCANAIAMHPDFFKWSFVRDPVQRAVSYWAMGSSTRKWTKTCKTHRYPQTWSLFGRHDNCPIFDFLGTTGPGLSADFEVVLRRLNISALWDYYRQVGLSHANKSDRNKTAATLRAISQQARWAIVERYRQDYVNLGFALPEGTTL